MSYVRPIRKDELVKWLVDNGFAQDRDTCCGEDFGPMAGEKTEALADALLKKFDLVFQTNTQ